MINNNNFTKLSNKPNTSSEDNDDQHSTPINLASIFLVTGFIVIIFFLFYQNLNDASFNRDKIMLRQVELLNILKTSSNGQEMQHVVNEYDSLTHIINDIEHH